MKTYFLTVTVPDHFSVTRVQMLLEDAVRELDKGFNEHLSVNEQIEMNDLVDDCEASFQRSE